MKPKVIVVDDDAYCLTTIKSLFAEKNISVETLSSAEQAINLIANHPTQFKMAIVDYQMPVSGDKVVKEIKRINPEIYTVILSADETKAAATACRAAGADHFYRKEKSTNNILLLAEVALHKVKKRNLSEDEYHTNKTKIESILKLKGRSSALLEVAEKVEVFSKASENVLITGESGVGKEQVAKAVHLNSTRKTKPFIAVNCGAIPSNLIESELFGHTKGSFTGATENKAGKFLAANEGTIFLDEIGEMGLDLQVKLLRVLQEREIVPVGSNRPIKLNVRVIAATNRNLKKEISAGRFREDLYYRLNILPIHVPALSERKEDIIPIVEFTIDRKNKETGESKSITPAALKALENHIWQGNVRELDGAVRQAYALSGSVIETAAFAEYLNADPGLKIERIASAEEFPSYKEFVKTILNQMERKYLEKALILTNGNKPKAAELAKIPYTTYLNKREKLGLDWKVET